MSEYSALGKRTQGYALEVKRLFDEAVRELLDISKAVESVGPDEMFTFGATEAMKDRAQRALRKLHASVKAAIERGVELEWGNADKAADKLVATAIGKEVLKDSRYAPMLKRNDTAMRAFMRRADGGMNLSKRIWRDCESLRKEMEMALTVSIGEGESASTISRRVRGYLNEPDRLFRRVRDEKGNLVLSKAAREYHPGRGVYRSSYKNAMRLARTETNMAYRTEDGNRMSSLDFVLGIRISLSNNHNCEGVPEGQFTDICDELQGDYPKTFKWSGWHPQCRCHMTSILPTREEMKEYNKAFLKGEPYTFKGMVKDYPDNFKEWVVEHGEKIDAAEAEGKLPYFIRDNKDVVDGILGKDTQQQKTLTIKQRAAIRHAQRTEEERKKILHEYDSHRLDKMRDNIFDISIEKRGRIPDDMFNYVDEIFTDIRNGEDHTVVRDKLNKLSSILTLYDKPQEGVLDYARGFALRSDEIRDMLFKARTAKGRDLDQLKDRIVDKCAVLTRSDLKSLGYTKGLSYDGMVRNKQIGFDYTLKTKAGESVDIKSYTVDLLCFTDKDGFKYYYPISNMKQDFLFNASDISGKMGSYDGAGFIRRYTKGIISVNKAHPLDDFYKKEYPNFTQGAMYASDPVTVHHRYSSVDDLLHALTHESGHHLDSSSLVLKSKSKEWADAVKKDGKFPTTYAMETATIDYQEDFADSVAQYYKNKVYFSKYLPNRFAILENLLGSI